METVCKKASNKLRAFARITPYIIIGKKTLMNQFFDSHSSKQNTKIDNRHERCLRLIYSGRRSCYGKRMEKDDLFLFIIGRFRYL